MNLKEVLDMAMPDIARRVQNELMIKCPVDTGRLRNSIKVKEMDGGILIWMADYAKYIEFGSLPHVIKPKNKKALFWKGVEHPVKEVHHPGSRPNPFIRNTLQTKLRQIITEEMQKVIYKI